MCTHARGPRGRGFPWAGAFAALLTLATALLAFPGRALASDQWSQPARGLRLLHRHTRHADGTPLDLYAVVADLCDPAIELRATAPDEAGETVSAWARRVGATAAVNGDYFDGTHMRPLGPARGHGQWWPEGPREHRDALLLANASGQVSVLDAPDGPGAAAGAGTGAGEGTNEGVLWRDAVARVGAEWTEVVGVRERIVVHGAVHLSPRIRHDDDRRHPRTGIGLSADGHTLVLLVVNGRSESSSGATAQELGELLVGLGAWEGMKLDGGGSSTLFVAGRGVLNHPSDGHERHVANEFGVVVRADAPPGPRAFCAATAPTAAGTNGNGTGSANGGGGGARSANGTDTGGATAAAPSPANSGAPGPRAQREAPRPSAAASSRVASATASSRVPPAPARGWRWALPCAALLAPLALRVARHGSSGRGGRRLRPRRGPGAGEPAGPASVSSPAAHAGGTIGRASRVLPGAAPRPAQPVGR